MELLISQIIEACQRLDRRGFVANHDGNISVRLDDGTYLATPTSFSKADVTADDLLVVDSEGRVVKGQFKVFSEIAWHLSIYKARPDVRCVVHGHPPVATGLGIAGQEIGVPALPEAIVSLGRKIPLVKFLKPGGDPMLDFEMSAGFSESDAVVVQGNGVWAVGNDPMHAYLRLELVEQVARAHAVARLFGGPQAIPPELVEELLAKRPSSNAKPSPEKNKPLVAMNEGVRAVIVEELMQVLKDEFSAESQSQN